MTAATPKRRTKPAAGSKAAALALSTVSTLAIAAAFAHGDDTSAAPITSASLTAATAVTESTVGDSALTDSTPTDSTLADNTSTVVDGTYVGTAASNRWGAVQVQAVYAGGVLVDVQILSYPDGERRSVQINQQALPMLVAESLSLQSADVDTVSGATYTSTSYRDSLQSAIDSAMAASGLT